MTTVNSNLGVANTDVITACDLIKHTVHYASKHKFCFAISYLNTHVIKFLILLVFSLWLQKKSSIGDAHASVQVLQALITAAIIHRMFREELAKNRVHIIEAIQGKITP
jgi:hypothetical protein